MNNPLHEMIHGGSSHLLDGPPVFALTSSEIFLQLREDRLDRASVTFDLGSFTQFMFLVLMMMDDFT